MYVNRIYLVFVIAKGGSNCKNITNTIKKKDRRLKEK